MRPHIEFIFGIIILILMAAVLWKFIEPEPVVEVVDQSPAAPLSEGEMTPDEQAETETPTSDSPIAPDEAPAASLPSETDPGETVACTMDAKMCPDGSYVGRVGPDCAFAPCSGEDEVQPEAISCDQKERPEMCYEIYAPVCGLVQVECVTTPCNPVLQTFSNDCFACANDRVLSYTEGACVREENE
jgi:hypothetical protein